MVERVLALNTDCMRSLRRMLFVAMLAQVDRPEGACVRPRLCSRASPWETGSLACMVVEHGSFRPGGNGHGPEGSLLRAAAPAKKMQRRCVALAIVCWSRAINLVEACRRLGNALGMGMRRRVLNSGPRTKIRVSFQDVLGGAKSREKKLHPPWVYFFPAFASAWQVPELDRQAPAPAIPSGGSCSWGQNVLALGPQAYPVVCLSGSRVGRLLGWSRPNGTQRAQPRAPRSRGLKCMSLGHEKHWVPVPIRIFFP